MELLNVFLVLLIIFYLAYIGNVLTERAHAKYEMRNNIRMFRSDFERREYFLKMLMIPFCYWVISFINLFKK